MDKTQEAFYTLIESLGVEVLEREGIHGISVDQKNINEVMVNIHSIQGNLIRMILGLAVGRENEVKTFVESVRVRDLLHKMVDQEYRGFMAAIADDKFIVRKEEA